MSDALAPTPADTPYATDPYATDPDATDPYAHVPRVDDDATPDDHWSESALPATLPSFYMPAAMPGPRSPTQRVAAWVVIVLLITAAGSGICLTYGPGELFAFLR